MPPNQYCQACRYIIDNYVTFKITQQPIWQWFMFEVTGDDIANLSDADLRELVKKLAVAELRGQGCPISAVIAGAIKTLRMAGSMYVSNVQSPFQNLILSNVNKLDFR